MTTSDALAQLFAAGHIAQPGAPLATPGQRLVESRALAILGRPELDAARDRIAALFRADRNAKLADQDALIAQSVAEHALHGALVAASETPRAPRFVWTIALAREWLGQVIPGSRIGQDNPDNVYRFVSVDPAFSYRISGCFPGPEPRDFSICAGASLPGTASTWMPRGASRFRWTQVPATAVATTWVSPGPGC